MLCVPRRFGRRSQSEGHCLSSAEAGGIVGGSGQGDDAPPPGVDDPCGHTQPVQTQMFELLTGFLRGQNEEFEPLSEIVCELGDHQPRPIGGEVMTREGSSSQAVLELLDIVLSASSAEVMLDQTAARPPAVGEDGIVAEFADHTLVAFVVRDSLDDHAECLWPCLGPVWELTPVSILLPGIGFPLICPDCLNGPIEGGCELSGDAKLHAFGQEIGDYRFVVEAGVHAHPDVAVSRQTREATGNEACGLVIAVSVSGSEFNADQEPVLSPEAQQWMESPDSLVAVASTLFKEAVDLEDGAVQIQGDDFGPADKFGTFEYGVSDDPLELLYVSRGELAEELSGGSGSGHLKIVEVGSGGLFPAESFQIRQVRPAYEEVVDQAHDEVWCGDAASSLLNTYSGEIGEDAEPVGDVRHQLKPRERGDLVAGADVVDLERESGYLHLTSAPFLAEVLVDIHPSFTRAGALFHYESEEEVQKITRLPVDLR